jgi:hypothetical protein
MITNVALEIQFHNLFRPHYQHGDQIVISWNKYELSFEAFIFVFSYFEPIGTKYITVSNITTRRTLCKFLLLEIDVFHN